jgi:hypothetical protein
MLILLAFQVMQRCTYCGPDDAWGRVYCEGKSCADYFFNDDNPDTATKWRECSADQEPFTSMKLGWMRDVFNDFILDPTQKMDSSIETCRDDEAPERAACKCKNECNECSEEACRTPDGDGGFDCWGDGDEEPFACADQKIARFTGEVWGGEYFQFVCCTNPVPEEELQKLIPGTMKPLEFAQLVKSEDWLESATFEAVDTDSSGGIEYEEFYQFAVPLLIERDGCNYGCSTCKEVDITHYRLVNHVANYTHLAHITRYSSP